MCPFGFDFTMPPIDLTDHQKLLIKLQVEYGDDNDVGELIRNTYLVNNDPTNSVDKLAFPLGDIRRQANRQRQEFRRSQKRGTNWVVPSFDPNLYASFKPNDYIEKLRSNERAGIRPSMARKTNRSDRRSIAASATRTGDDEESVDASFTNTSNHGDGLETLSQSMGRVTVGGGRVLTPNRSHQVAEVTGSKYAAALKYIQMNTGYGTPGPVKMMVTFSPDSRLSDNGTKWRSTLHIKVPIQHPDDEGYVSRDTTQL